MSSSNHLTFSLFGVDLDQGSELDWAVVSHAYARNSLNSLDLHVCLSVFTSFNVTAKTGFPK